jgi:hypothetical protein
VVLSIVASLSGLVIVGPLASYEWSRRIVSRKLSSAGALFEFWSLVFKKSGGVMAVLLSENPNRPKPDGWECKVIIAAEYETYRRVRYWAVNSVLILGGIWYWTSLHLSFWILFWFLSSTFLSAIVNRDRGARDTLVTIFRAVRLAMWGNPKYLDAESRGLGVTNVVDVLLTVEPNIPHPPNCLCDRCLEILSPPDDASAIAFKEMDREAAKDSSDVERLAQQIGAVVASDLPAISRKFYGQQLFREKRDFDEAKMWDLQLEDIFLTMHLLDRFAFPKFTPHARAVFVNALVETLAEALWLLCPTGADAQNFRMWFGSSFNLRTKEYGKCRKFYAEKDEQLGGTLFWEFGTKMSSILSDYNPATTISIVLHGSELFRIMLETLEPLIPGEVWSPPPQTS